MVKIKAACFFSGTVYSWPGSSDLVVYWYRSSQSMRPFTPPVCRRSVAVLGWARGHRPPNLAQAPQLFDWFRSALFLLEGWGPEICQECVGGRGFAPDPAGGAQDAPPDPLVGWGGGGEDTPSQERHASRHLDPRAFSVQRSLLGATFLAYTHLNVWQYTTNWFYSNFA